MLIVIGITVENILFYMYIYLYITLVVITRVVVKSPGVFRNSSKIGFFSWFTEIICRMTEEDSSYFGEDSTFVVGGSKPVEGRQVEGLVE